MMPNHDHYKTLVARKPVCSCGHKPAEGEDFYAHTEHESVEHRTRQIIDYVEKTLGYPALARLIEEKFV